MLFRHILFLSLSVAWMAFVSLLSSQTEPLAFLPWVRSQPITVAAEEAGWLPVIAHTLMFGILALLLRLGVPAPNAVAYGVAFTVTALFGAADELHQRLTPGRDPAVADFLVDCVGAAAGLAAYWAAGLAGRAMVRLSAQTPKD